MQLDASQTSNNQKRDSSDRISVEDNASLFKSIYNSNSQQSEEMVKILQQSNKQKEIDLQAKEQLIKQLEQRVASEKKQAQSLNAIIS